MFWPVISKYETANNEIVRGAVTRWPTTHSSVPRIARPKAIKTTKNDDNLFWDVIACAARIEPMAVPFSSAQTNSQAQNSQANMNAKTNDANPARIVSSPASVLAPAASVIRTTLNSTMVTTPETEDIKRAAANARKITLVGARNREGGADSFFATAIVTRAKPTAANTLYANTNGSKHTKPTLARIVMPALLISYKIAVGGTTKSSVMTRSIANGAIHDFHRAAKIDSVDDKISSIAHSVICSGRGAAKEAEDANGSSANSRW